MDTAQDLAGWIGRETLAHDVVTPGPVRGLLATIASTDIEPAAGSAAPILAHWLYFLPYAPLADVGPDGHPKRGGFMPPIPLPRRMWAGSRLEFLKPLRVGAAVTRRSVIGDVKEKSGRTGALVFVRVDHEVSDEAGVVLRDSHDIVFRDLPPPEAPASPPPPPTPAPENPQWARQVDPDPVLLFRYSALTFNGHRIHYDQPYVTQVEGYPGLIVHGPLLATLLVHELTTRHPGAALATFTFRAVKPVFDTAPFFVCGSLEADGQARLFIRDAAGALCMDAAATLR